MICLLVVEEITAFVMSQVIWDRLNVKDIRYFLDLKELRAGQFDENILIAVREAHSFISIVPKNELTRCVNKNGGGKEVIKL